MSQSLQYHLQLTGYVGASSFSARTVRSVLARYPGKHVDVLIESYGGSLAEGLAICGAFRDHGDVTVHFRGMSASAATIAAMGAANIEIAPEAMILVHQVSMEFFDWAARNADQLDDFIKALQAAKEDLDTMDLNIAQVYAARCRKKPKDMLELMRRQCWLTADQAREWGFVDSIAENKCGKEKKNVSISQAQASAFDALGLPLPPVPVMSDSSSFIHDFLDALKSVFKPKNMDNQNSNPSEPQNAPESTPENAQEPVACSPCQDQHNQDNETASAIKAFEARLGDIEARIEALTKPATKTVDVISNASDPSPRSQSASPVEDFCRTSVSARKLFDAIN